MLYRDFWHRILCEDRRTNVHHKFILLLLMLVVFIMPKVADADWPMARHDPRRTGAANGTSNITKPAAYWRYYLGGSLSSENMASADANGDGVHDLIMVNGGRVFAKAINDTELWSTPPRNFTRILGIVDLNGDGVQEVVAYSNSRVYVLAIATGEILWAQPEGEMGTIGGARLADLQGDGLPEVIVTECGCCAVNGDLPGVVYSFAASVTNPERLWELATAECGHARALTVVNADGQGASELLLATYDDMKLYDGTTGQLLASSPYLGTWTSVHYCLPIDIDTVPGEELVCFLNSSDAARAGSSATEQRKVTVLTYRPASSELQVLWSAVLAPNSGGNVFYRDPVVDLDGDGNLEVVVSSYDGSAWTTRIFAADTGLELASIASEIVVGPAPLENADKPLLLTSSGTTLTAWSFNRAVNPPQSPITSRWTMAGNFAVTRSDGDRARRSSITSRLMTLDLNGDGVDDLVTYDGASVQAHDASDGQQREILRYTLASEANVQGSLRIPPVTEDGGQLVLAYADGSLIIHNTALEPASLGIGPLRAILRVGGYYASGGWRQLTHVPVVSSLGDVSNESILAVNAQATLLRLDGKDASFSSPPQPLWQQALTYSPAIVPSHIDEKPAIASLAIKTPVPLEGARSYEMRLLKADGSLHWSAPVQGTPLSDIVPGKLNEDGLADFIVQWGEPSDVLLRTRALSGADGTTLWSSVPVDDRGGRQPAGVAVYDWDNNGQDDVCHQAYGTRVLSGANGSELAYRDGPSYFMPTILSEENGGTGEIILHGGYFPIRMLSSDLASSIFESTEDDRPFPYGAVVRCTEERTVFVSGSLQYPARVKMTELRGASVGQEATAILAGGKLYQNEADARAAGAWMGQLSSFAVHSDLDGTKVPLAVVGSADGWLYAFNPCEIYLAFTLDIGAPVGQPVFGDLNGDGKDSIVVTAADGYLYAIEQEVIGSPSYVWDIDLITNRVDDDVDVINHTTQLSALWEEVPGAESYEVSVVASDGTVVTNPAWQNVGKVTQATVTFDLQDNEFYRFAVRALSSAGRSVDVLSDGVVVELGSSGDGLSDAGTAGQPSSLEESKKKGCGCDVASFSAAQWLWWLAAFIAFVIIRRKGKISHR